MYVTTVLEAVTAAGSGDLERVVQARMFAEDLGAAAWRSKEASMPAEFVAVASLRDGFEAGYEDARCGAACVEAGLA